MKKVPQGVRLGSPHLHLRGTDKIGFDRSDSEDKLYRGIVVSIVSVLSRWMFLRIFEGVFNDSFDKG